MKSKCSLHLYFGNEKSPGLYRTVFWHSSLEDPIVGIRGTTIPTKGLPFIWGPSSQALALLFVTAVYSRETVAFENHALLEGPKGSPAGTLARLMKKRSSSWLLDLFGADISGRSLLHKMIIFGNPRGRQHGPISASLREEYLSPTNIQIFIDGEDITNSHAQLSLLKGHLLSSFIPRKDPLAGRKASNRAPTRSTPSPECRYVITAERTA
jgi:hypothetical protein